MLPLSPAFFAFAASAITALLGLLSLDERAAGGAAGSELLLPGALCLVLPGAAAGGGNGRLCWSGWGCRTGRVRRLGRAKLLVSVSLLVNLGLLTATKSLPLAFDQLVPLGAAAQPVVLLLPVAHLYDRPVSRDEGRHAQLS